MNSWLRQLVSIQGKGYEAALAGKPVTDCPYHGGYRNQNGAGGSVQRQRREAWLAGYAEGRKKALLSQDQKAR